MNQLNQMQFSNYVESLADSLSLSQEQWERAEKRYKAVGKWLDGPDSQLQQYSPDIYPQGSFNIGTINKPKDDEEIDIDLVCELQIDSDSISPTQLKELVGGRLKAFVQKEALIGNPIRLESGTRCWTLHYPDGDKFHMDVLPAIPDDGQRQMAKSLNEWERIKAEWSEDAILISDKNDTSMWLPSDPKGYARWFKSKMQVQLLERMAKSLALASVDDVPEYRVKTTLQQAIQILKYHRDQIDWDEPDDKPISIIITTLSARAYDQTQDVLYDALMGIVKGMPDHIDFKDGEDWVQNPVNDEENFADKWKIHPQRKENFLWWLSQVQGVFQHASGLQRMDESVEFLEKSMGKVARATFESMQDKTLAQSSGHQHSPLAAALGAAASFPIVTASELPTTFFDVPQREKSPWPMRVRGKIQISAKATYSNKPTIDIPNNGPAVPKGTSLLFTARIEGIKLKTEAFWQVVNTGKEAAGNLRGSFEKVTNIGNNISKTEGTQYQGTHWIQCFILAYGSCVAKSDEFVINIQ